MKSDPGQRYCWEPGLGLGLSAAETKMAQQMPSLIIPTLREDERTEDWKPLFIAAVTLLTAKENGEKLAIGLLPAYVNRRPAERELVKEVIEKCETLDDAFKSKGITSVSSKVKGLHKYIQT